MGFSSGASLAFFKFSANFRARMSSLFRSASTDARNFASTESSCSRSSRAVSSRSIDGGRTGAVCDKITPSARSTINFALQHGQSTSNVSDECLAMRVFYADFSAVKSRACVKRTAKKESPRARALEKQSGSRRLSGRRRLFALGKPGQRPRLGPQRHRRFPCRHSRCGRRRQLIRQLLPFHEQLQFARIEHFALQQPFRYAFESVTVRFKDRPRLRISQIDDTAYFDVDLDRRILGIIAMLRDLAAQENRLFLAAEGQRTERTHAPFANHLPCDLRGALDVIARTGGDVVQENFLCSATAHQHGQL